MSPSPIPGSRKDIVIAGAIAAAISEPVMAMSVAPPAISIMSPPASAISPMSWRTEPRGPRRSGSRGEVSPEARRVRRQQAGNSWGVQRYNYHLATLTVDKLCSTSQINLNLSFHGVFALYFFFF